MALDTVDSDALGVLAVTEATSPTFGPDRLQPLEALGQSLVTVLEQSRRTGRGDEARRLRLALESGELVPWFQPVVQLADGRPHAVETVLRWQQPHLGVVGAAELARAVASSGLSLEVGRHTLHVALRAFADLRAGVDVPASLVLAVPVAPRHLVEPGLADEVLADLEAHRIAPACLALEIPEPAVFDNPSVARPELQRLRDAGVQIVLDDFGSGRAGHRPLLDLPVTALRLSSALVGRLSEEGAQTLVRTTVKRAEEAGVRVVAAGVNTAAQRDLLLSMGCAVGQGHLFGPPVAAASLPRVLGLPRPLAAGSHTVHLSQTLVTDGADVIAAALAAELTVAVLASPAHREALARELAARGVAPTYLVVASVSEIPAETVVWTDLAMSSWAAGDVTGAIALEDELSRLRADVHCGHTPDALQGCGTEHQVRRLIEQHADVAPEPVARPVSPDARSLIAGMVATGASHHSISAALNAANHPTPYGVRWHWKQVGRVLEEQAA
ncbi:MAG: hypothetical protein JWO22_335 [Frankiales bacterium]|nr:hypothetical protein [Frankiales bacterium]